VDKEARIVYTAGYRGIKAPDFAIWLKEEGVWKVIDVRRYRCRAPKGLYYGGSIIATLEQAGMKYLGFADKESCLGNYQDTLDEYQDYLFTKHYDTIDYLAEMIMEQGKPVCFICAEKQPYEKGVAKCHRVFVADAVAKRLEAMTGEDWIIEHLINPVKQEGE